MIKYFRIIPLVIQTWFLSRKKDHAPLPGGQLDPLLDVLMRIAGVLGGFALTEMTPGEARENRDGLSRSLDRLMPGKEALAMVRDLKIPVPDAHIPIRVYNPEGDGPLPVMIYYHGGGWVIGSIDTHDQVARGLADRAGCVVVSVGYRLAPENPFPAAVEDAYSAVIWAAENALAINGDAARIGVAGDSAGGNLAAAAALMARDREGPELMFQALIYPVTDLSNFNSDSYDTFAEGGYGLNRSEMEWFRSYYLQQPEARQNPLASPLLAEDLSGLPRAFVATAEFDVLRDEGEAYAARLREANVPVMHRRYNGMLHGFLSLFRLVPRAEGCLDDLAAALREAYTKKG